jgi:hypothetical protein
MVVFLKYSPTGHPLSSVATGATLPSSSVASGATLPSSPVASAGTDGNAAVRPTLRVSVAELDNAYSKDLATADSTYLNKAVELSGVTGNVEKDAQGRYFIGIMRYRQVKTPSRPPRVESIDDVIREIREAGFGGGPKYVPAIILYIRQKDLDQFAGVGGKTITVRGVCNGTRPEPTATPEYEIVVEDCTPVLGK